MNDFEQKEKIRHKQQRLLLLNHSAKCPHNEDDAGRCMVTPHCANMKQLWRHIQECKDNRCQVAHCFSSRGVLSHYRKCREANCPVCGPVRDTIRNLPRQNIANDDTIRNQRRQNIANGSNPTIISSSSSRMMMMMMMRISMVAGGSRH